MNTFLFSPEVGERRIQPLWGVSGVFCCRPSRSNEQPCVGYPGTPSARIAHVPGSSPCVALCHDSGSILE